MQINLGDYELIYSVSVIQIEELPMKVKLPDSFEGDYYITFSFTKDIENRATVTKATPIDKYHLQIDFVNFYDSEQVGNVKLMEIGTLRNLPLFLNYRIIPIRGSSRTVLLNFYTRKEA